MIEKVIATYVYPGALGLDIFGPLDAFHLANAQTEEEGIGRAPYKTRLIARNAAPVELLGGLRVAPDCAISDIDFDINTLFIPGARSGDTRYRDPAFFDWLRREAARIDRLGSICSGALILAESGAARGRRMTTHWMDRGALQCGHADIDVVADRIFCQDGNLYSSGGVTAGIDLALHLIEADLGRPMALKIAKRMIVFLRRQGDQTQFSDLLSAQMNAGRFDRLMNWIEDNLETVSSVDQMAEFSAMSARNFSRQFSAEIGMPPMKYVEARRVERAKTFLEQTDRSLATIARACGFREKQSLARAFNRLVGISPRQYRARFGAEKE